MRERGSDGEGEGGGVKVKRHQLQRRVAPPPRLARQRASGPRADRPSVGLVKGTSSLLAGARARARIGEAKSDSKRAGKARARVRIIV